MSLPSVWLDIVILLLLIVGLAIGYAQGLVRQVIGLAALYIGAILGAQYYTVVAGWVHALFPGPSSRAVNAFGFFVILIAVVSLLNWLAFDAYHATKLNLFPLIDHMGGSILGLITTVIIISFCVPILTFATGEPWPWSEAARYNLITGLQSSRFLVVFQLFTPGLLGTLAPWLPNGLPSIFNL